MSTRRSAGMRHRGMQMATNPGGGFSRSRTCASTRAASRPSWSAAASAGTAAGAVRAPPPRPGFRALSWWNTMAWRALPAPRPRPAAV